MQCPPIFLHIQSFLLGYRIFFRKSSAAYSAYPTADPSSRNGYIPMKSSRWHDASKTKVGVYFSVEAIKGVIT